MELKTGVVLFAAAMLAGAINAVAGGGTMLTFPALVWAGVIEKAANATSTVALWPGSLGGMWGYRRELRQCERWLYLLGVPSVLGGITGAILLLGTPAEAFKRIVPYLILFATVLFMLQERIGRFVQRRATAGPPSWPWLLGAIVFQSLIAVYGGYFGAGIGILMLSALSLLGIGDIHQMNGLKTLFALCINGVAAACFVLANLGGRGAFLPARFVVDIDWWYVVVMVAGSLGGGYGGARFARRLGQRTVRRIVVCVGFALAGAMLWRQFR